MVTKRLVANDGWQATYSPDGKRILCHFNSGFETPTVLNLDGSNITHFKNYGRQLHWIDDNSVVFVDIRMVNNITSDVVAFQSLDESVSVVLSHGHEPYETIYELIVSPDKEKILLFGNHLDLLWRSSGRMERIAAHKPVTGWSIFDWFSPDSKSITLPAREGLLVKSIGSSQQYFIKGQFGISSWHPYGDILAVQVREDDFRSKIQLYSLTKRKFIRQVAQLRLESSMIWSPDGQFLLFSGEMRQRFGWVAGIFTLDFSSGKVHQVDEYSTPWLAWAPTSDRFLSSNGKIYEITL